MSDVSGFVVPRRLMDQARGEAARFGITFGEWLRLNSPWDDED